MEALLLKALVFAQIAIMFSLGVGLSPADFKRVFERKRAFFIGVFCQTALLPLMALALIELFQLSNLFAAGLILLSLCPGGVSSNVITRLSRGDVALSVSLTAVVSACSFISVPILLMWTVRHYLGAEQLDLSFFELSVLTLVITTLPVSIGMLVRMYYRTFALRAQRPLELMAVSLWVIMVLATIAESFDKLLGNFLQMGTVLITFPVLMIIISLLAGRLAKLENRERKTLAVETSIQNSPLGITLAAAISGSAGAGITELALPAAVYAVTTNIILAPTILLFRRWR